MDGKDCWRDNVFVERLWRSVKYEKYICMLMSRFHTPEKGYEDT